MGEPINRIEIVLKKEMGYVDRLIGWAGRHPYLSAVCLLVIFLGGGIAVGQLYKSKDSDGTTASAAITIDSLAPTPAPTVVANASAKETAVPDYYDEVEVNGTVHKVGIYMQKNIQTNVTKMLSLMKEKTPERYKEVIPFLDGTHIVLSNSGYNWGATDGDIGLAPVVINLGGSDDITNQLAAISDFYMEARGIMADKTGERKQFKNYYESELFQHSNMVKYEVEAGIRSKEAVNKWLKSNNWFEAIEGRYPTAEELNGVDIEKYLVK